jgi:hypothetical protein
MSGASLDEAADVLSECYRVLVASAQRAKRLDEQTTIGTADVAATLAAPATNGTAGVSRELGAELADV